MTKVKICGITNAEDALLSAKFGADALGFNFYAKSPRYLAPEKAREIIDQLPPEILKVGVFVNESLEKIAEIAAVAKLDALQLHGEETPEFARELKTKTGLEIIKAFRVDKNFNPLESLYFQYDAILLDAYSASGHGGTGEKFDWWIANATKKIFPKMYLAGGLAPQNIVDALNFIAPFGVDVCSGVEKTKGVKDGSQLGEFIKSVRDWEKDRITNIYELFDSIKKYPGSYFEQKSLTSLTAFLNGFQSALNWTIADFDLDLFEPVTSNVFSRFIEEKLRVKIKNEANWNGLILNETNGNEEEAFDLFFTLLEEFKLKKEDLSESDSAEK
jgi:phosphoribosylanthranilate isomerase